VLLWVFGLSQKTLNNFNSLKHGVWKFDVQELHFLFGPEVTNLGAELVGSSLTHGGGTVHVTRLRFGNGGLNL